MKQWAGSAQLSVHGVSTLASVVQHAALLEPELSRIILESPLMTWQSLVLNEYYKPEFIHSTIPGALGFYDLPDVCAAMAPRELHIITPVDEMGRPLNPEQAHAYNEIIRSSYSQKSANERLRFTFEK